MIQVLQEWSFREWFEQVIESIQVAATETEVMYILKGSTLAIGFEKCAYGLRLPAKFSEPEIRMNNNYPIRWAEEYQHNGFVFSDPTVLKGLQSTHPMIWNDQLFENSQDLWEGARSYGLEHGWSQSYHMRGGAAGLLTFVRSHDKLTPEELRCRNPYLLWLSSIVHTKMEQLNRQASEASSVTLTERELEILRWTADGKTAVEVGNILNLATDTVNFHLKKITRKLDATNKVAAVAKAVMQRLI